MNQHSATWIYTAIIVWLFLRDRKLRPMTSLALWVPLAWLFILGSKPVSFWITGPVYYDKPEDYLEGSPIDAASFLILIVLGVVTLARRNIDWKVMFSSNRWVFLFFGFMLLSIAWTDFPFTLLKRWVKDFGNVIMVLVILTEPDATKAIRAVLCRFSYLAVCLSMLYCKYYPNLGRYYDRWTWTPVFCGLATEKNAFGVIIAISGIVLVWDIINRKSGDEIAEAPVTPALAVAGPAPAMAVSAPLTARAAMALRGKKPGKMNEQAAAVLQLGARGEMNMLDMALRALLLVMMWWCIIKADSSNAQVGLFLGAGIAWFMKRSMAKKKTLIRYLGLMAVVVVVGTLAAYLIPGVLDFLFGLLGENSTLTGRTDIWAALFKEDINPIFGTGYQDFWLGAGAARLWEMFYFHPNQAHNGYIDTWVSGGAVGVALLLLMLFTAGARMRNDMLAGRQIGTLMFGMFVFLVVYNWSEAMFNRMSPVWFVMLLTMLTYVPQAQGAPVPAWRRKTAGARPIEPLARPTTPRLAHKGRN